MPLSRLQLRSSERWSTRQDCMVFTSAVMCIHCLLTSTNVSLPEGKGDLALVTITTTEPKSPPPPSATTNTGGTQDERCKSQWSVRFSEQRYGWEYMKWDSPADALQLQKASPVRWNVHQSSA